MALWIFHHCKSCLQWPRVCKLNGALRVLIEKGRLLLHSEAVLRIAELLDNQVIRVLAVATRWGFPRWLRDWVYTEIISKYRRQIFGETDSCRLMEPGWEHRFL